MNAKSLIFVLMIATVLLGSCAPAATQFPIAIQPKQTQASSSGPVIQTRIVEATRAPYPTSAPAATLAPRPAYAVTATPAPYNPVQGGGYLPRTQPPGNTFQDPGINPYIETYYDHLSTFAVDVDTASYTVARRYLRDGSLPPEDAIRVEEFVNYFKPGYNPPENAAFALYADGAVSPFSNDGTVLMRIGIQGYRVPDSKRTPASLTFVIDISGSMNMENRLGLVKQSLRLLVERLRQEDTVTIVVFGSSARLALEPTRGDRRSTIQGVIDSLRTEGSTNAEAGLRLGYEMAMRTLRPGYTNKVVLCSDGVANTGITNPDVILDYVHGYIKEGVTLTALGFGMGNFNDALLERLADKGDGMYAYIDTLDEARKLFVDELTSTLQVIALDAKTQVDFNPEVVARYRLLGYENRAVADQDFRNDAVDAGEIGAGHSVVAVYAVQLQPGAQGRMATVQLRWKDPQNQKVTEINGNFNTWDLAGRFEQAAPRFRLAAAVAQFAEALRGSPWASRTSLYQVYEVIASLKEELDDPDVSELAELVQRAARMWRPAVR